MKTFLSHLSNSFNNQKKKKVVLFKQSFNINFILNFASIIKLFLLTVKPILKQVEN